MDRMPESGAKKSGERSGAEVRTVNPVVRMVMGFRRVTIVALVAVVARLLHLAWIGPVRRWRLRRTGLCIQCGYNLEGNVSGVCSECGRARTMLLR